MIQKWKCILINWINCYFNESGKNEQTLHLESLYKIISHLRESFNLDKSKSSILGAHTVEEFLLEKYPEFKFENGTVEARNEEEVYLAASLLLFFVCVNSKEVDIKNAMCSRLSREDQEIILKFSKSLMDCSPILCGDVQGAITEACCQHVVGANFSSQVTVAETPPVLRSLHGEVRRLQASLDAERFDRNYLQEELSRTNLRVEQLLKDKEQYKLDIVNLKARISLCCGQENEVRNSEAVPDCTVKLTKELNEIERQLIQTQGELEDVVYERDAYKLKVEEIKQDRDKWLALSQQEVAHVNQLVEELETERHNVISLKELVNELRLHNKLNRVDSSLLECDDPDTSIQSLHHNSSVCSEACANVIEVQLGEERAKIIVLQEQIQTLQDRIKELSERYGNDKQTYETIINERETDIFNLKHRINEEVEEKSNLKAYFNDEVNKLNNEVNELEQRLKGNSENSRSIIERKMQEIKILQEEKLTLLESLDDETTKNENIIKRLKEEIDFERRIKLNMKDSYENQIMKFNEKILNRNNELVELQNNILEKSEIMESLYLDLRKEKEMREELSNKYHNDMQQLNEQKIVIEQFLEQKSDEVSELKTIAEQKITLINDLQKELNNLKLSLSHMNQECKYLEETKEKLSNEIQNRDSKLEEIYKDIENLKNLLSEEKEKLTLDLDEKNATINGLKKQLEDEINYKISLESELTFLQKMNAEISEELRVVKTEVHVLKTMVQKKDETIEELDIHLRKEKEFNAQLKSDHDRYNEYLNKLTEDINKKEIEIKSLCNQYENSNRDFQLQLSHKEDIIEITNEKLKTQMAQNESLQDKLTLINNEKLNLEKNIQEKNEMIMQLETDSENKSQVVKEDKTVLEEKLMQINKKYKKLEKSFDTETSKMIAKLNETEKVIKELSTNSKKTIRHKELQIQKLSLDLDNATKTIQNIQATISQIEREKEALVQKLDEEVNYKNNLEKEYQNQCLLFSRITAQLNEEVGTKKEEVVNLKTKLISTLQVIEVKAEEIKLFQETSHEAQVSRDLVLQKNIQIKDIMNKLKDIESLNIKIEQELQNEKSCNAQSIQILRKENEKLQFIIEEENSNHEVLLKEKDHIIDSLEQQIKNNTAQLESVMKDYEDLTLTVEKFKFESQEKEEKMYNLMEEMAELKQKLFKTDNDYCEINKHLKEITKEKEDIDLQLKSKMLMLEESLCIAEEKYANAVKKNNELILQYNEEKALRDCLESEKVDLSQQKTVIFEKNKDLLNAKEILAQEILEEKSINKSLEEQKNIMLQEKMSLEDELVKVVKIKDTLIEENSCLTQQLIEEKSTIELFEKEKELLKQQLTTEEQNNHKVRQVVKDLMKKHTVKYEEYIKLEADKQILETELERLNLELIKEHSQKNELTTEQESLICKQLSLEHEVIQCKAINEAFLSEKEVLLSEKETLVKSLGEEKSALDEIENEKNILKINIEDLSKKHELELKNKLEEVQNITKVVEYLKMDCEDLKRYNATISTKLNSAFDKLIHTLKREDISNEVLQKLTMDNGPDMNSNDKCDLLINIADTLTTELSMRKNLEKALEDENTANNELRELCKQKEIQIFNLQTDVKRLEQIIHEHKLESLKEAEVLSTTVNSKVKDIQTLHKENEALINSLNDVKLQLESKVHSLKEKLTDNENLTDKLRKSYECQIDNLNLVITKLTNYLKDKTIELDSIRKENEELKQTVEYNQKVTESLKNEIKMDKRNQKKLIEDFESERLVLKNMVTVTESVMEDQKTNLNNIISQHMKANAILQQENETLMETVEKEKDNLVLKLQEKDVVFETILKELSDVKEDSDKMQNNVKIQNESMINEVNILKNELCVKMSEIDALEMQNKENADILQKYKDEINTLEKQNNELKIKTGLLGSEKQNQVDEFSRSLDEQSLKINRFQQEIDILKSKLGICEEDLRAKDGFISKISREKDEIINAVRKELSEEKIAKEKSVASYVAAISAKQNMEDDLILAIGQQETCFLQSQDKTNVKLCSADEDRLHHQVDNSSSDFAHSSTDSLKTISDLERILNYKNRKITTLQTDITYLRSILAESETQLIDVRRELEMSKENCQQLSSQLKKIVYQKNEDIAELKRQINKMSVTENRATQIIKVSAKYQAIILKKIAEIKSNTALKELTNFGNTNSCDNELRRSIADSVTMEDLENFLETTDRHLKRCAEKQASLQKDRDRLTEVNRISESEIINLRKYLMEISVSYQTFSSVKDLYVQKLSRVLSIQRTVRREILSLDGHITAACMCKLERGYAAIMQDLSECAMNLERWVERFIIKTVTPEKIKQAFVSDEGPVPLSSTSFQNAGLEVQIEELENSFKKLLEEVTRASKGEGAMDAQAITVTEVRAEYEDKLNRMKAKMNQLYHEQIGVFKEKQREEIALLQQELQKTRDKHVISSKMYEKHIKELTAELWRAGEKYLVEKVEADGLRRKNRSDSLMSLQYVHSSGLAPTLERIERPSESYSLRSLPSNCNAKREGRDLLMSDEDEVFDNRCLKELAATPRREFTAQPGASGVRLSELQWRNSMCLPHLKSSYPAETQFAPTLNEEDIKFTGAMPVGKQQRKEVGITAYKKPGPPTPSKQAGRLSATDSELRESLRIEADPHTSRKTSTPSRLRSLFRASKNETNEGTPRRRLSNIFRKK